MMPMTPFLFNKKDYLKTWNYKIYRRNKMQLANLNIQLKFPIKEFQERHPHTNLEAKNKTIH
jgi:hypothetical protein